MNVIWVVNTIQDFFPTTHLFLSHFCCNYQKNWSVDISTSNFEASFPPQIRLLSPCRCVIERIDWDIDVWVNMTPLQEGFPTGHLFSLSLRLHRSEIDRDWPFAVHDRHRSGVQFVDSALLACYKAASRRLEPPPTIVQVQSPSHLDFLLLTFLLLHVGLSLLEHSMFLGVANMTLPCLKLTAVILPKASYVWGTITLLLASEPCPHKYSLRRHLTWEWLEYSASSTVMDDPKHWPC